jgi:hypothetical protein
MSRALSARSLPPAQHLYFKSRRSKHSRKGERIVARWVKDSCKKRGSTVRWSQPWSCASSRWSAACRIAAPVGGQMASHIRALQPETPTFSGADCGGGFASAPSAPVPTLFFKVLVRTVGSFRPSASRDTVRSD